MKGKVRIIPSRINSKETKRFIETVRGDKNWVKIYKRRIPLHAWLLIALLLAGNIYLIHKFNYHFDFTGLTGK